VKNEDVTPLFFFHRAIHGDMRHKAPDKDGIIFISAIKKKKRMRKFSISLVYVKIVDFFTFSSISLIHYSSFDPFFLSPFD